jgi:UDP-N-acetylglucosamine diphosphorylase / glucose-1-phosphate thymidylyltransferase / UDP-N-acetylgalactosamine diphosphorylase / glucosamine-1-phosphate N-acetyltransferase / galactosamine-1-phosphate N-acetyltransferase
MPMLHARDFFDLSSSDHAALFEGTDYVWQAIPKIAEYIRQRHATDRKPNLKNVSVHSTVVLQTEDIIIGKGTRIEPGVMIKGPAIIGENCTILQGAYLRENVILADGAIVGHTSELKNVLMLEGAAAPHFSYLGDSILGARVNLGAGTKLSNLPITSKPDPVTHERPTIILNIDGQRYDTGLSKMGAVLGDDVQIGCNAVLNPGCVIGARTWVYALASLSKGYYPPDSIIKIKQQFEIVEKREL